MIIRLILLQILRLVIVVLIASVFFEFEMHDVATRGSEMSRKFFLCFFIPIIVFACAYVDCYSLNHHQRNSEKVSLV